MAPPESQIAALDRLGETLLASFDRPRPRDPVRVAMAAAVALLVVASLVGAAFTPVGRAVTDAIGDLIGIGDAPTDNHDRDAVVIGLGEQNAFRYEVVASGRTAAGSDRPVPCLTVEFPGIHGLVAGTCLTDAQRAALSETNISQPVVVGLPKELYPQAEVMVQGLAVPEVGEVRVDYTGFDGEERVIAAELSKLSGALNRRIGTTDETQAYVAFLPPDLLAPPSAENGALTESAAAEALRRVSITALDADGNEIGSEGADGGPRPMLLAIRAPEARFANEAELKERCRALLGPAASEEETLDCAYNEIYEGSLPGP